MSFNLATILRESALAAPDKPLVHAGEATWTYRDVDDAPARRREHGRCPGDVPRRHGGAALHQRHDGQAEDRSPAPVLRHAGPAGGAGGTWSLFRYPCIRSDSDMHTLGYAFKPWTQEAAIASGAAILDDLHEAVAENDLAAHVRLSRKVRRADWSSETRRSCRERHERAC
jgi:hypothetical protein